jgi:hypothetical protein
LGYTTGNVPNLVGKVTYGAQSEADAGVTGNYTALGTIATHNSSTGAQTPAGVGGTVGSNTNQHSHTVPSHSHTVGNHSHTVNSHDHSISGKSLDYQFGGGNTVRGTLPQSTGVSASAPGTSENGGFTVSTADTSTTGNGYQDNRTAGVGMLKIMKVKNL